MNNKPIMMIEVTVTEGCNCHCSYCFETSHKHINNEYEETRQLGLIKEACENIDFEKYSGINISFWGGEPLVNFPYFIKIIEETYKYNFVSYHLYSNGTLFYKFQKFLKYDFIDSIKNRFHIQFSYDGDPHHFIKRHYDKDIIFKTTELLRDNGFTVDFKATLTVDMFDKLPEIWDSYYQTFLKFDNVRYNVTVDTTFDFNSTETFETWKKNIQIIGNKEYKFFKKYGFFLSNIFNLNERKMICNLNNTVFIHTNGNIYSCHGCPYLINNEKFILGNTKNINSFFEILETNKYSSDKNCCCSICGATYCAMCHVCHIKYNDDLFNDWSKCISNNLNKCKYYKYLGFINKILKFIIIKDTRICNG